MRASVSLSAAVLALFVVGTVLVFRDLKAKRRAAEALVVARDRDEQRARALQEANRELEAFSYSVSHDLRAPLRHVSGYIDLLRRHLEPALDEKAKRYVTAISEAAAHLGHLVDDLLAFSRTGRVELRRVEIDMRSLVREAIAEAERAEPGREVVWTIGDLPDVLADPQMLRLVLANLLSNAVKYTRGRAPARIELRAEDRGGELVFSVRDNGAGFDMLYADKLFGVFQRLHGAAEFEGTGIGLASVRRIVARHGGRTWAEGAVGQGATFYFSLPRLGLEATG
jgi:light-regulated signal transduction histidine kinase (bacteriophytochrome)